MRNTIILSVRNNGEFPEKRPFELAGEVQEKRRQAVIENIVRENITSASLVAFMDKTLFGNGKKGYAITNDKFYGTDIAHPVILREISQVTGEKNKGELNLVMKNGETITLSLGRDRNYIGFVLAKIAERVKTLWYDYKCDANGKSYFTFDTKILDLLKKAESVLGNEKADCYTKAAEMGNPYAMYMLYKLNGDVDMLKRAFDMDYPHAITERGIMHKEAGSIDKAENLFRKAALMGDGEAAHQLFKIFEDVVSDKKICEMLRTYCEAGIKRRDNMALLTMAKVEDFGYHNNAVAEEYYKKAANNGSEEALRYLVALSGDEHKRMDLYKKLIDIQEKRGEIPKNTDIEAVLRVIQDKIFTVYDAAEALKYLNIALECAAKSGRSMVAYTIAFADIHNSAKNYVNSNKKIEKYDEKGYKLVREEWAKFEKLEIRSHLQFIANGGTDKAEAADKIIADRAERMDPLCRPYATDDQNAVSAFQRAWKAGYEEAGAIYTEYAEKGNPYAMYMLSVIDESDKYIEKAAEMGYAPAVFDIGLNEYNNGADAEKGENMIAQAAAEGYGEALHHIFMEEMLRKYDLLPDGIRKGVENGDYIALRTQAKLLDVSKQPYRDSYEMAAMLGDYESAEFIADVKKDEEPETAWFWYKKAVDNGIAAEEYVEDSVFENAVVYLFKEGKYALSVGYIVKHINYTRGSYGKESASKLLKKYADEHKKIIGEAAHSAGVYEVKDTVLSIKELDEIAKKYPDAGLNLGDYTDMDDIYKKAEEYEAIDRAIKNFYGR